MNWALAILSGFLLILPFPRFDLAWLAPVAPVPLLFAAAREPRPRRRFLLGYAAGVVYWFGIDYWIQFVLSFHGGLGAAAGWAVFLLFCLAKSVQMGIFALVAGIFLRRWWAIPAVSALWVALEISHEYTGFAWLPLGNAGIDMSLPLRLAPYTGVYGLSFVFLMLAAGLALALLRRPRQQLLWLLVLPFLIFLPSLPDASRGAEQAVLVQPNISQNEQWTRLSLERAEQELGALSMKTIATAGGAQHPSLLVWPEVPAPFYYYDDPHFREAVTNLARVTQTYFLLGIVGHTRRNEPLNSAILISPAGELVSRYDKIKLVPFGEFVPWPFDKIARHISTEISDFVAGDKVVVSPAGAHRIGAFICYESVFPHLVRQFANGGAEVMFNLSNDGYFGKSAARLQHLKIVRMRAAENRRWILRATNDGYTAIIDSAGRLRGTMPPYVQGASRTGFNYVAAKTLYTAHGDWFALSCAAITLALLSIGMTRGERARGGTTIQQPGHTLSRWRKR